MYWDPFLHLNTIYEIYDIRLMVLQGKVDLLVSIEI
jgi:hypothetical protein